MDVHDRITRLEQALEFIYNWARAYPPSAYPRPDYEETAKAMMQAGLTVGPMGVEPKSDFALASHILTQVGPMVDLLKEDCLRQAIYGIGEIAHEALKVEE